MVVDISVKKDPNRMIYTEGEKLDLNGIIVEMIYENGSEDVKPSDFAIKRITTNPVNGTQLKTSLHNNAFIEITYTYNNTPKRTTSLDKLAVFKKVIPSIAIDGYAVELNSIDGKEFTYVAECGRDEAYINITQTDGTIKLDGDEVTGAITIPLNYGDNSFDIIATPNATSPFGGELYKLTVKKPFPAEQLIKTRWGNTLTVIQNSRYNPYDFTNYTWYRNGREIGSGRSYSAGPNGEKLNPKDKYHVEATTDDGKTIRSCEVTITNTPQNYGILLKNNYAAQNIGVEIYAPEEIQDAEITVHDINGKQILKQTGNYDLNISKAPSGVYIVTAKTKGESGKIYRYSAKFVVKK